MKSDQNKRSVFRVSITDGDKVRGGKRSETRDVTIIVGHVGRHAGVHDPPTLLKSKVVEGGDERQVVPC
jgi:hypothetical protein